MFEKDRIHDYNSMIIKWSENIQFAWYPDQSLSIKIFIFHDIWTMNENEIWTINKDDIWTMKKDDFWTMNKDDFWTMNEDYIYTMIEDDVWSKNKDDIFEWVVTLTTTKRKLYQKKSCQRKIGQKKSK